MGRLWVYPIAPHYKKNGTSVFILKIQTNWSQEEVSAEAVHDVTAASGDITVDSVRDHTNTPGEQPELNINLQVCTNVETF